ncbi:MAG: hypothetical protein RLY66_431 [Candidatus Parcubacteria bacterium]|jgi:hypothetical protein
MIIFGWGFQTIKNFGPVFKKLCSHCHNEHYWVLTKIKTWFTLFFIPVFPYKIEHYLSCPVCKYGVTLNGDQFTQMEPLAETNQLLVDGKITNEEYHIRISLLSSGSQDAVKSEVVETEFFPKDKDIRISYCSSCGTQAIKELKFCGNCGISVAAK